MKRLEIKVESNVITSISEILGDNAEELFKCTSQTDDRIID